jgi:hypothetical protein
LQHRYDEDDGRHDEFASEEIVFDSRQPIPRGSPPPPAGPVPGVKPPPKPRPWLGYLVLLGCLAGFGYSLYITPGIIAPLSVNPLVGPTSDSLVSAGAKVTCLINGPPREWWRLVSPMCVGGVVWGLERVRECVRCMPLREEAGFVAGQV